MSFDKHKESLTQAIDTPLSYRLCINELKDATNKGLLFGNMELVQKVINRWQLTISVLPKKDKDAFLQNLSRAMGINDLLK